MKKKLRKRSGFTLMEILAGVAIVAILIGGSTFGYSRSQEKSRHTNAMKALDAYEQAFMDACLMHPRLVRSRLDAWTSYSSKTAFNKLVSSMNEVLEDDLMFTWDDTGKYYKSRAMDPWGGNYILCEYPESATESKFDPTLDGTPTLRFSVWASGSDEGLLLETAVISGNAVGAGFVFAGGLTDAFYQSRDSEPIFSGCTIQRR